MPRGEAAFTARAAGAGAEAPEEPPLEQRVADLECFCGQLAWENAQLKTLQHGRS